MRAIRFEAFGDPSVLKVVEMAAPDAEESTAAYRLGHRRLEQIYPD